MNASNQNFYLSEKTTIVSLRPNDFDWSQQLNNSVFVELLEIGRWDWSLANGLDLRYSGLVGVVARLELNYLKPVFWNPIATLQVRTKMEKFEQYSIYIRQNLEETNGVLIAQANLRLALFDSEKRIPVAIHLENLIQKS
jgi:acyl-CoA thioesterase FadM